MYDDWLIFALGYTSRRAYDAGRRIDADDYASEAHDWRLVPEETDMARGEAARNQIPVDQVIDNWYYSGRHDRAPRSLHPGHVRHAFR